MYKVTVRWFDKNNLWNTSFKTARVVDYMEAFREGVTIDGVRIAPSQVLFAVEEE